MSSPIRTPRSSRRGWSPPRANRRYRRAAPAAVALGRHRCPGKRWSIDVIHHEKCCALQTRRRQSAEYASSSRMSPLLKNAVSALRRGRSRRGARDSCPWRRWAARCAPRRRSGTGARYCIGSTTKLRIAEMPFSVTGTFGECPAVGREPRLQLLPDARVGPFVDALIGGHLQVQAADARRPHAEQREAALVIAVDELLARRRDSGENAEPRRTDTRVRTP